ncbi:glycosyltransferase family 2 protein [Streptomyces sp. NPDC059349]|uniref:glycosyltransferase family 2 protein n=1 Tax=Streptomyces sp. NPDC059349 TaxID=3346808 RepID=UPI0036BDD9C2
MADSTFKQDSYPEASKYCAHADGGPEVSELECHMKEVRPFGEEAIYAASVFDYPAGTVGSYGDLSVMGAAPGTNFRIPGVRTQFLIPVWNDLLSLVICLPSVLAIADHVVLCDDGSTDGSFEYIESLAREGSHEAEITLVRAPEHQGWTQARRVLTEHQDPNALRVWADADDLFVPELWPRFVQELREAGCLPVGFHEVWGDSAHTTHWGLRGDPCHIALWPGDTRLTEWSKVTGFTTPVYREGKPEKVGPMCAFHMNGYKTDGRLAYKGIRLERFNHSGELDVLADSEVQDEAERVLFENFRHRPVAMPKVFTRYLNSRIPEPLKFSVVGRSRSGNQKVERTLRRFRDSGFRRMENEQTAF